jgi:DNA polymerase-3 subunit gamma/tau
MTLLRLHAFRPERAGAPVPAQNRCGGTVAPAGASAPAASGSRGPACAVAASADFCTGGKAGAVCRIAPPTTTGMAGRARLPLTGMAKQLAQHCELVERERNLVRLRLAPAHKHLLGKVQQEKLQAELQNCWGGNLRLEIAVAEPAARDTRATQPQQRSASARTGHRSIEQDPFVRDVVDLFDASIDESTIKPV